MSCPLAPVGQPTILDVLRCEQLAYWVRRDLILEAVAAGRARLRDRDGDGVPDVVDNCRDAANPSQDDFDLDGLGDCCDRDDDNDHDPDRTDPAPRNAAVHSGSDRRVHAIDLMI